MRTIILIINSLIKMNKKDYEMWAFSLGWSWVNKALMPICDSLVRIRYEKLLHVLLAPSSLKELCKSDKDSQENSTDINLHWTVLQVTDWFWIFGSLGCYCYNLLGLYSITHQLWKFLIYCMMKLIQLNEFMN